MHPEDVGDHDKPDTRSSAASLTAKTNISPPVLLKDHDVEVLAQSDGFNILRQHLAQHYSYPLCDTHAATAEANLSRWLIGRDVLHSLLVPVVELFDKACLVASWALNAIQPDELEYAFTDQARGAFVWLQSFLASEIERDWCYTRGCPACVIEHSLDSEFTVRLLCAACLLSDVHYPFTLEGPTLPSFMFLMNSLEDAVQSDELFGEDFFERMQPKAVTTRNGIESLIHQCLELDIEISQPSTPNPSSPESSLPTSPVIGPLGGQPGMKIRRSKLARRQRKIQMEEEQWSEIMLSKFWDQTPVSENAPSLSVRTKSMDALLKSKPVVSISDRQK